MDDNLSAVEHRLCHRVRLADLCNALGIMDAVEIGTHQAVFANEFMERFNGTIVMIDPWDSSDKSEGGVFFPCFFEKTKDREEDMNIAVMAMEKYGVRARFVRSTGDDALKLFRDESVGFVYIDGLHDFDSVSNDIRNWWRKVSPGGILAGHDYWDEIPDVIKAVDDHQSSYDMDLNLTSDTPASWWFRKPERSTR